MDELINLVAQRTGLAPDQARTAVDTVLGFLKTRLPGPVASQLDSLVGGASGGPGGTSGGLGDIGKGLGGVFKT